MVVRIGVLTKREGESDIESPIVRIERENNHPSSMMFKELEIFRQKLYGEALLHKDGGCRD